MIRILFALVTVCAACTCAAADPYPTRPVRIVVPFAPGGGLDILARLLGLKLGDALKQTIVIDNRTGAGGNIGAEIVAKAAPDGYTLLLTSTSLAVNASLYSKLGYDARRDFAPVSLLASVPLVLVANNAIPRTLKELVAAIKAKPGAYAYASNGAGTTSHLSGELLGLLLGAKMTHVPYKGGVPAMISVAAGDTQVAFTTIPSALPFIKSAKVNAIAVSTKKPSAVLPNAPTVASVVPGFDTDNWYGLFAPAATPAGIVQRVNAETVQALKAQDVRDTLVREGSEPIGSTPQQFAAYFPAEIVKYAKVVKASGATSN
ncbi:MAG TPA: tripartite tricarboxylate transporter substrate binding protein [Burkholderiales bacterium]|nr:tripartite tricarboxylate transporter substrate binding protein [Burkholderiales bacterium]